MAFRLGIWGWWQGRNLGDQWIKETLSLFFPSAEFVNTKEKVTNYDFLICGGGGLFFSEISRPWKKYSRTIPFGVLGLGSEFDYKDDYARTFQKRSKFFFVRDAHTLKCMHLHDVPRSYDLTFANPVSIVDESKINLAKCLFVWRTPSLEMTRDARWVEYQKPHYDYKDWSDAIYSNFKDIVCNDFETYNANIETIIDGCGFVVSGRYHGIIAAIQRGVPCIGIDLCPKIRAVMKEAGIEEYCIKLNEVEKLGELIKKAKTDFKTIRKKELAFRAKASSVILQHIDDAKLEISKIANKQRFLYYGKYFFGKNDVVSVMADSLKKVSHAKTIEIKNKRFLHDKRIAGVVTTPNGEISILKNLRVLFDVLFYRPNAIILNSGGLCFDRFMDKVLTRMKICKIGIELSDPDVYPYNGNVYSKQFDIFYTNASYTIENQNSSARLLGFGASNAHHHFMPDVIKKYDIVVVGGCRPDRIPVVEELQKHFCVGVYGPGWKNGLGPVSGIDQVKAINSGKIYLSFAKTMAGFSNVKVGLFEAVACRAFVITDHMEELSKYFEIDKEIVTYSTIEELVSKVRFYLEHEEERNAIADNCYQRFLNSHTYEKRLNSVIRDYYKKKGLFYE